MTPADLQKRRLDELLDAAAYGLDQAARYVGVPRNTLRDWVQGRSYPVKAGGKATATAIIVPADLHPTRLSFNNLLEAHVLEAVWRQHRVKLQQIRQAVAWMRRNLRSARPLIEQVILTDGKDVFVQHLGELINASREGQRAMSEVLDLYLRRIDRDATGLPVRLYPFTRPSAHLFESPRIVAIDPRIAFGRPVLATSSAPTGVIAERYQAGESIEDLADDYGETPEHIQEAIRCELQFARAA